MQKVLYVNKQIKESEERRLKGLADVRGRFSDSAFEEFERHSLKEFIRWYIQRSLNAQWRMGFNLVREELKHRDEVSGFTSMEAARSQEVQPLTEELYQDEGQDDQFKAAQALIRSSGYKSQFADL